MPDEFQQHVSVHLSGQDDNLGDSVLRDGLLQALRGRNRKFHIVVRDQSGNMQTSDYSSGLALHDTDVLHDTRRDWVAASTVHSRPVYVFNAGEINPRGRQFPGANHLRELAEFRARDGVAIAAGIGIKEPSAIDHVRFPPAFREVELMSWRDNGSQEAAGFGEVNPDWAFALGTASDRWSAPEDRPYLTVTLRFDRPYPDAKWLNSVRELAVRTDTRIVTIAQVGRDAPRAVRLANDLGGRYIGSPSFSHDVLD